MYQIEVPGCEGQRIEVKPGSLFSGYKLLVDGQWRLESGNNQTVPNSLGTENNVLIVF